MPSISTIQQRATMAHRRLKKKHPDARPELDFGTPFQFLVAIILSAQATDVGVNQVTPGLFARFPDAFALSSAEQGEVEQLINRIGLFRNKAKAIIGMARQVVEMHQGEVPKDLPALVNLPGVGRKTANVFLGGGFGINSGIAVDTHVGRVARRLGLTTETNPDKVEQDLLTLIPKENWHEVNKIWVLHGRYTCIARKPKCDDCPLSELCPKVGVEETKQKVKIKNQNV